jgi:capsular exopolysaccharide synthesis family protein
MSKLQSSIQKAIEMARQKGPSEGSHSSAPRRRKIDVVASGVLRIFQPAVPHEDVMEESRIVTAIDDRNAKAAYNVLRTRVLQRMRSNNWHSILVTSPGAGEGKTLTASNLAVSLARDVNQTAVLVDLDLMRSSVGKYLGIDVDVKLGIGDYLAGKAELADIIYSPTGIDRLAVVPNREPMENSSDLLGSPRMKELLAGLHEQFDKAVVICDMPPVLACDDVLAICPIIDAILVVVAQGKTERTALEQTMTMLAGYNILGVVLNMSNESGADGAYGYY